MTSTTPAPSESNPAATRTPGSVFAIVAFAIVVLQSVLYFTTKTIAASITASEGDTQGFAMIMGVLGILSLLPPVAAVVLGHLAIRQTRDGNRRGRVLAIAAVALGYLHIAMWANRILVATIAALAFEDSAQIVPNIFWWA